MTLLEKIEALSDEQQEKISVARNKEELLVGISEVGIVLTVDEEEEISRMFTPENTSRALTDEEVSEVSGGMWFKRCPYGVLETGYAWGISKKCKDCSYDILWKQTGWYGGKDGKTYYPGHGNQYKCTYFNAIRWE